MRYVSKIGGILFEKGNREWVFTALNKNGSPNFRGGKGQLTNSKTTRPGR
jgi:hypothetical protein